MSGVPRSGTSLMMRLLEAAGIPPMTDAIRVADADNPGGYFELERVKQLGTGDDSWLDEADGHAVKVISTLLPRLPFDRTYDVVVLHRDLDEVVASQRSMLERRGQDLTSFDAGAVRELLRRHVVDTDRWLAAADHLRVLHVDHHELLERPAMEAERLAAFLDRPVDEALVRSVVDPALYRNRRD